MEIQPVVAACHLENTSAQSIYADAHADIGCISKLFKQATLDDLKLPD